MKILAVSDRVAPAVYHEHVDRRFSDVELVVSCGDLRYDYLEFLVSALNVPLLYVHGNHDRPLVTDGGLIAAPRGCTHVGGRVVAVKGLLVAGLGGSIRYRPQGAHQYTEWEMRWRAWRLAPRLWRERMIHQRHLDILLTHAPPQGIHDQDDPAHRGFRTLRAFIHRWQPRFLLHGHTYPRRGVPRRTQVNGTQVVHVHGFQVLEVEVA
ncbi:MAG: metallophosphoesterase family protein [Candidatus Bipolaricaulaceae bacterium]